MRVGSLRARISRLEAKRGASGYEHLTFDQVERVLFKHLRALATNAGGIVALMDEWDAAEDPQERQLIARIRACERDVATYYRDLEGRLS